MKGCFSPCIIKYTHPFKAQCAAAVVHFILCSFSNAWPFKQQTNSAAKYTSRHPHYLPRLSVLVLSWTKITTFRTILDGETCTADQRWICNMKLEMYVGVVSLFSPCDYVDFFFFFWNALSIQKCWWTLSASGLWNAFTSPLDQKYLKKKTTQTIDLENEMME